MNLIKYIENTDKAVAAKNILRDKGTATLLKIKKDGELKEHQSATNALLILLSGQAVYTEGEKEVPLSQYLDYVHIPAKMTHKVKGVEDALLLLVQ